MTLVFIGERACANLEIGIYKTCMQNTPMTVSVAVLMTVSVGVVTLHEYVPSKLESTLTARNLVFPSVMIILAERAVEGNVHPTVAL